MKDISKIDKNFEIKSQLKEKDIRFYNANEYPFKIYGVFYENGKFRRMPENIANTVSDGVYDLHTHTAGGRVRFKTDSPYLAINVKMPSVGKMPHFTLSGSAGFDLYLGDTDEKYYGTFVPPFDINNGFESIIYFGSVKMRDITINFPLYSEISDLHIGLRENATIEPPSAYSIEKPIVYYGSSITQGGCASRPGNSYQSIISRKFNTDYINLGFSGNAKGEPEMAEYISNLDMSIFVYDYDHNAPTNEHLNLTHEKLFKTVRAKHPLLPIIILTRPRYDFGNPDDPRYNIIKTTYDNAKSSGDRNVYFIDGKTLMKYPEFDGTVDGTHPNDWGFASMANALSNILKNIL